MIFNKHGELKGKHAIFAPSSASWLNYDDIKIADKIRNQYRKALGTELHEFVAQQIVLSHKPTTIKNLIQGLENYIYTKYQCDDIENKQAPYGFVLLKQISNVPKEAFETAKAYISDGIAFHMAVEQPLYYSECVFGTADTISFRDSLLRIHDYKSGDTPAGMDQLQTYAALFCLEYVIKPKDIDIELRLYQHGEIGTLCPTVEETETIMDQIVAVTNIAEKIKAKEERYE